MDIQEKAKEYDKMVEIIKQHNIESDGMFAEPFTYSAVLEDVLERYLDNLNTTLEPIDETKCEECDNSKKLVKKTWYFIAYSLITDDFQPLTGCGEFMQVGEKFDFKQMANYIKDVVLEQTNKKSSQDLVITFYKELSTEWVEESELK